MTDSTKGRWQLAWTVLAFFLPYAVAGFVAFKDLERRSEARLSVLEARIQMHEASSTEVSASIERRLATIESDIKMLLSRPR